MDHRQTPDGSVFTRLGIAAATGVGIDGLVPAVTNYFIESSGMSGTPPALCCNTDFSGLWSLTAIDRLYRFSVPTHKSNI